ncbi:MAG: nucleotidyltransferase family protein [Acidithiobacillus sp.]|uniref:nucleotidyltransferase family protein n=1 Tax=Acidithiobacillus sp. TaxID=1872118 RepID=UPI003D0636C0
MGTVVRQAMILAAGRGERLRPLSDYVPKPLLEVAGRPLLYRHLERFAGLGLERVVINIGHLGGQIRAHIGRRCMGLDILYSDERDGRLETGGAIVRARDMLGDAPFLLANGDICSDFDWTALTAADATETLVLVPNPEHHPQGDFAVAGGRVERPQAGQAAYTYSGMARLSGAWFAGRPAAPAPLGPWLREWAAAGRLAACLHQGLWFDVGTVARWRLARRACGGRHGL